MSIYYLGPKDSYSYILAKKSFPEEDLIACNSFSEIVRKVISDTDSMGVLPIENSITSNVHENVDHIFANDLQIVGEAYLKIKLHLVGIKGARLNDLKEIYSHPKALRQCWRFIEKYDLKAVETESTTRAKELVIAANQATKGCIGSQELAKDEKLQILKENIGNLKHNITRFIFIRQEPSKKLSGLNKKMTFIFKLKHQPGTLAQLLTNLAKVEINLTKIESRPIPGTDWEYDFWVDLEVPTPEINVEKIFKENTLEYRVVGVYRKGRVYES